MFGGAALIGAAITAFYMSRLFFMTFHGKKRWTEDAHPHESPLTMTMPMIVLAFGSAFLGLILGPTGFITNWLEPVVGEEARGAPGHRGMVIMTLTLLLVAAGAAWRGPDTCATRSRGRPGRQHDHPGRPQDLYQDAVNEGLFMRPGIHLTRGLVFADAPGSTARSGGLAALIGGMSSRCVGSRPATPGRMP